MKYPFFVLYFTLFISCTIKENDKNIVYISDYKNTNIEININDVFKIPMNDSCFISDITQISKVMNNLIIVDANKVPSVHIINLKSNTIKELSFKGTGPKDYIHPAFSVIDYNEKVLNILDIGKKSIMRYDIDNNFHFINERKIPFNTNQFHYINENKIIWNNTTYDTSSDLSNYKIILTDSNFIEDAKYFKKDFFSGYDFNSFKRKIYTHENITHFYFPFSPTIYTIDDSGIDKKYQFSIEGFDFPSVSFLKSISSNNQNYIPKLFESPYVFTFDIFENKTHILFSIFKQMNYYYAVYDKISNESKIFTAKDFEKKIKVPFISPPIAVIDNNFVSVINNIEEMKNSIVTYDKKGVSDLKNIIENSAEDDNPILIYYTFN